MGVKQVSADTAVAPNLVPMVDIMFLLLLFFMLGADMGQRELEEVMLPIADSVKEDKQDVDASKPENQRLTINVHHDIGDQKCQEYEATGGVCRNDDHWAIAIRGQNFNKEEELKQKLMSEVEVDREKRGEKVVIEPGKPRPASELKVMIRADGASLYSHVQRAMNACGSAGIYKIEIGAAQKPPE
jgi:biopolymer transport protein ExbD